MNVSLPPELEKFVTREVEEGYYKSVSDVIRAGLLRLVEEDRQNALCLGQVRTKIQRGLDQLDRGEGISGEEVYAQMKRKSEEIRKIGK